MLGDHAPGPLNVILRSRVSTMVDVLRGVQLLQPFIKLGISRSMVQSSRRELPYVLHAQPLCCWSI
jgi:hypothetical protein